MKKSIFITIFLAMLLASASSQVQVFTGGRTSIGDTIAPLSSIILNVKGNTTFVDSSSAMIKVSRAYSDTTPNYTWLGNDRCGISHPASDNIGICMQGSEKFRFTTTGIKNYGNATFFATNASAFSAAYIRGTNGYSDEIRPNYSWYRDEATGIFHPDTDIIAFTTNGSEGMRLSQSGNLLVGSFLDKAARLVVDAGLDLGAFITYTNFSDPYAYAHVSYVNDEHTKNWVVNHNEDENFFVYGDGTVWAGSGFVLVSDSILKENVQTLQDARSKVLSLRGVSFNFKPEQLHNPQDTFTVISTDPPRTQIGFIAEEVERVVPQVVLTNDHGIKGIAYQNLVALLVEAFKQQSTTLDSLKAQLALCCNAGSQPPNGGNRHSNQSSDPTQTKTETSGARLDQNTPNPFSSKTEIHFYLPEESKTKTLVVFDMQGTLLKQYPLNGKGESSITISGNEFKPGMYLYTLLIDGKEIDTKRMILTN